MTPLVEIPAGSGCQGDRSWWAFSAPHKPSSEPSIILTLFTMSPTQGTSKGGNIQKLKSGLHRPFAPALKHPRVTESSKPLCWSPPL